MHDALDRSAATSMHGLWHFHLKTPWPLAFAAWPEMPNTLAFPQTQSNSAFRACHLDEWGQDSNAAWFGVFVWSKNATGYGVAKKVRL